jgi:hypothetical protein
VENPKVVLNRSSVHRQNPCTVCDLAVCDRKFSMPTYRSYERRPDTRPSAFVSFH